MIENINEILIVAIVNEIQGLEFVEIEEKEIEGEAVSALRYPTGFT